MHLSEGILPAGWAAAHYAAATPFVLMGAHKIKALTAKQPAVKPLMGLLGAAVFVISALPIPVPISGTCAHPTGVGLAALFLGPLPAAAITLVVLLIQSLFMAHGGLSTLGANTLNMGVIGAATGYTAFLLCRWTKLPLAAAAFAAGFFADLSTYAGTATSMALALHGDSPIGAVWATIALAFAPTQIPLALLEGIITAGVFTFIQERRPDILAALDLTTRKSLPARWWAFAGAAFLAVLVAASVFRPGSWEGVDVAVVGKYAGELGATVKQPFLNIQGDLLLFIFTLAGLAGGFIMGYVWRSFPRKG
ncbi:MAG: energy-coupling factor ABC transporter permease [Chloroflexi bacterium]|nr:energy-coupling factor ABC transporter permease [Chloroflexota bacterium]